ncbi:uncharacterized protein Z519_04346 [Cladophialophora bantiana CBS 173.52]|uniref:Acyl-coenzyme A oxidase N-terminal domain-containing protein n=1 Tax=Cladophialophora bantiana (strain ATCC 10958 / CBS 173.52 / CDC B-1940 / NIH 8579) TaxID=1442370 RepID=A0A0D2HU20_CLAB1|nr:uncharacterized protein Z519_04346 [Cladophialophora bantiana CBS 173.52]KIW94370.1 hypothetical protein Z519_04346 [Cladophialophora bantiana CBS 173.52]
MSRHIPVQPEESAFTLFLWGGEEKLRRRKALLKVLIGDPLFDKKIVTPPSLARQDAWTRRGFAKSRAHQAQVREQLATSSFHGSNQNDGQYVAVFLSNLERQMSDEQKEIWIPKAERFEIFGSYCQTELGYGSKVKGIETTATFDAETDEFLINSPTLSSTKYWIRATGV